MKNRESQGSVPAVIPQSAIGNPQSAIGNPQSAIRNRQSPISLDALLLILIVSAFTRLSLMTRLVPVPFDPQGARSDNEFLTKWFVMSLLLLGVFAYLVADIIVQVKPIEVVLRWAGVIKWIVLIGVVVIFDVTSTVTWIDLRRHYGPATHIHDGALQVEEAIKLLLSGRNFYGYDYGQTVMRDWQGMSDNPALHHFVYLPFLTLFSAPFHLISQGLLGWYDQRFVYLFCIVGCLIVLPRLGRTQTARLCLVMVGLLNPALALYLPEGRNDIFTLFWLVLSVFCLQRRQNITAAVFLGLACASKQSAWPALPFFLVHFAEIGAGEKGADFRAWLREWRTAIPWKTAAAAAIPFALCLGPFLLWDLNAFLDDTIRYQTGTTAHSFPIRGAQGFGFGSQVLYREWVTSDTAYYPFWIFQAVVGLPLMGLLMVWQCQRNTVSRALISYGLLLFVTQYFARAFHDNYWGFIVTIVGIGAVMGMEDG